MLEVIQILSEIQTVDNPAVKEEIVSMELALPLIQKQVQLYMGHKIRAKAQNSKIKSIRESLTDSKVLLVIDHKQKVMPKKANEGQVEYFGKKGMSLLGAMLVMRNKRMNEDGIEEIFLEHFFLDCIIEYYSTQDILQVLSTLSIIIKFIKQKWPQISLVTIQSDNAPCLASHDNIPFVFHLMSSSSHS